MTAAAPPPRALGLDFGTTNTVLAWAHPHAAADPVVFRFLGSLLFSFRSALCFWDEGEEDLPDVRAEAGPWAIERFIELAGECRFIQSLKSFAASPSFESTFVFGRELRFEDLFAEFLALLAGHARPQLDELPKRLLVGRPVEYVGSRPDPALALERYRKALARFGFEEIVQVYEPVAAAFFFAKSLAHRATVLVADFGGGTTDFSVIAFEPRAGGGFAARALGHSGVGVAGDRFDYRLIERMVLPRLGQGTMYRSMGRRLELPRSCFASFARWHELSVLKGSRDFRDFREVAAFAEDREAVGRFIRLVESDLGYTLYRSVSETKEALSREEEAPFVFRGPGFEIRETVRRRDFEAWIAPELEAIEEALERVLDAASVTPGAIDRVFLTGGSSFVPAVRRAFVERFGAERIESGNEFVSIANGLATIGMREDVESWIVTS